MNLRLPHHLEIAFWDMLIYCMIRMQTYRLYRLAQRLFAYLRAQPRLPQNQKQTILATLRALSAALLGLMIGFLYGIVTAGFFGGMPR